METYRDLFIILAILVMISGIVHAENSEAVLLVSEAGDYIGAGNYEKALEVLEKALKLDPTNEKGWMGKGYALNELERYQDALDDFKKALELDPKDAMAWAGMGMVFINLDQYEDATESLQKAVDLNPEDEGSWRRLGICFFMLDKYEDALDALNTATQLSTTDELALKTKAQTLLMLEKYEDALDAADKALSLNPKDEYSLNVKGLAYLKFNEYEKALEAFENTLRLNPKSEVAIKGKEQARSGIDSSSEMKTSVVKPSVTASPGITGKQEKSSVSSPTSRSPGMNLTVSDEYRDGIRISGDIGGIEELDTIRIWIIGDKIRKVLDVQVEDPGRFSSVIPWDILDTDVEKEIYLIIQHPDKNKQFEIYPDNPLAPYTVLYDSKEKRGETLIKFSGTNAPGRDEIFNKIIQAFESHDLLGLDDLYLWYKWNSQEPAGTKSTCSSWGDYCTGQPDAGSAASGKESGEESTTLEATASNRVTVSVKPDSVQLGDTFMVSITGAPSGEYYIWTKKTAPMSGMPEDQPPMIGENQKGLLSDPVTGPYTNGRYQFEEGEGKFIKQDVPDDPDYHGTRCYGIVTLDNKGKGTVAFTTSKDTKPMKYIIRVERKMNEIFESGEVTISVKK